MLLRYNKLRQNIVSKIITECNSFEICPCAALQVKWFDQRTKVRLTAPFAISALLTTKFLYEKCGSGATNKLTYNKF
jgi:hypothetical protein